MSGFSLDTSLLALNSEDHWTVREALQHLMAMGGTGSGKTSGVGNAVASAMLRAGFGGLVLIAKPEELTRWRELAARHGRSASLIELSDTQNCFNFLTYDTCRLGSEGINSNIELLMRVLEAARNASPSPGNVGDTFWQDSTRMLLRFSLPIIHAATGSITIESIVAFVQSAPRSPEQMSDPEWQQQSFFCACFLKSQGRISDEFGQKAVGYWKHEFAALDQKTRGNIIISLTTSLDRFNHGWLKRTFCGATNVVPELAFHGAIILLNMPALTLNDDGIIAQQTFKLMFQRAVLARNGLDAKHQERPVFIFADECQYFVNSYDAEFLSTCRGSRCSVVYLTQSLPTLYAKMGSDRSHDLANHLLGNFGTKVFHSNGCPETNDFASRTIGRTMQRRGTYSEGQGSSRNSGSSVGMNLSEGRNSNSGSSHGWSSNGNSGGTSKGFNSSSGYNSGEAENRGRTEGYGRSQNTSQGYSEQRDYLIEPGEFGRSLATGGPAFNGRVSAVWYQAGRKFRNTGINCLVTTFQQ